MARRLLVTTAILLTVGFAVGLSGAIIEARWLGCSRATYADNSSFQDGRSSIQLVPPEIGCTYEATAVRPAETEHHVSLVGVALLLAALTVLTLAWLYVWSLRWLVRRARARTRSADRFAA